ncbi:MAG: HD-GYP domain-containing protein [Vicinamibacterales bacterium]
MPRPWTAIRHRYRSPLVLGALVWSTVASAIVLAAAVALAHLDATRQAEATVRETLHRAGRLQQALDAARLRERRARLEAVAGRPLLSVALSDLASPAAVPALPGEPPLATDGPSPGPLTRAVETLAADTAAEAVVLVASDTVVAAAGPAAADWRAGAPSPLDVTPGVPGGGEGFVRSGATTFRATWTAIQHADRIVGRLYILDDTSDRSALALSRLTGVAIVIADDHHVLGSSLPPELARAFGARVQASAAPGLVDVAARTYAFRRLPTADHARVYGVVSVDDEAAAAFRSHTHALSVLALGLGLLSIVIVCWVALGLVEPAERLVEAIEELAWVTDQGGELPAMRNPALARIGEALRDLLARRDTTDAATRDACIGAMRAMAAAVDARDPHMLGHSERVSGLAVRIGQTLSVGPAQIEILRLGALLHNIGNIAIPDGILDKPGSLTASEFDRVKTHPVLGASILRSVPFLTPHVPVVELHHERPDGTGYPYGLPSSATPLLARIVRVADAYEAMTSARAYRAAMTPDEAMDELWRHAGTGFDEAVVEALGMTLQRDLTHDLFEPAPRHDGLFDSATRHDGFFGPVPQRDTA